MRIQTFVYIIYTGIHEYLFTHMYINIYKYIYIYILIDFYNININAFMYTNKKNNIFLMKNVKGKAQKCN